MTEPELVIWNQLRGSPSGLRFRRQHPAGDYILDFYCHRAKLAIEIDGEHHGTDAARAHDAKRDDFLRSQGVGILRIPVSVVSRDAEKVIDMIVDMALSRSPGTPSTAARSPSPTGEDAGGLLQPASGRFDDGVHRFPIRVYFEDTDFSGIVYHANYLRFMERARSDMLRVAGIDQLATYEAGEGVYAVAAMEIQYKRPARLDDVLIVESRITRVRAAATEIEQLVLLNGELAVRALVTAALVGPDGQGGQRPVRQPEKWREDFNRLMEQAKGE